VAAGAASTLGSINEELARYRTVFTTNYDLLNYWAIQHSPQAIDDLFKGPDASFDLSATATDKTRCCTCTAACTWCATRTARRAS
jgi:hypothetical protein